MSLRQSTALAWGSMVIIVIVIIIAVCTRIVSSIWEYSTLFLAFMAIFCHLMSLMLNKMSANAAKKLDYIALLFGVLAIIALIVVFILDFIVTY